MHEPVPNRRRLVAALLDQIRHSATPPLPDTTIAWAIGQYSDAELLAYEELDAGCVPLLRRWCAAVEHQRNGHGR